MNRMKLLYAGASLLLAGCGAAAPAHKAQPDASGPLQLAPAPAAKPASATCEVPECDEKCADAGEQMAACVAAFEAGCFSETPPEDYDCDYMVRAEPSISDEADEPSDDDDGGGEAKEEAAGDGVNARTKDVID